MNEDSSRSHAIFTIDWIEIVKEIEVPDASGGKAHHQSFNRRKKSQLMPKCLTWSKSLSFGGKSLSMTKYSFGAQSLT